MKQQAVWALHGLCCTSNTVVSLYFVRKPTPKKSGINTSYNPIKTVFTFLCLILFIFFCAISFSDSRKVLVRAMHLSQPVFKTIEILVNALKLSHSKQERDAQHRSGVQHKYCGAPIRHNSTALGLSRK